jgi:CrcB protein
MTVNTFLLTCVVGLAGAGGALSRYLLGRFIAGHAGSRFPLGTLLINVTGALAIGVLFSLTARGLLSSQLQIILATGFLGGYTTFSTMSWEALQLMRMGSLRASLLYLGGNLGPGLAAAALGLALGQWL